MKNKKRLNTIRGFTINIDYCFYHEIIVFSFLFPLLRRGGGTDAEEDAEREGAAVFTEFGCAEGRFAAH
tara:strand:- start:641 stop:847 length:207 start_codon:yes stop_codon:yes gene_type:complete